MSRLVQSSTAQLREYHPSSPHALPKLPNTYFQYNSCIWRFDRGIQARQRHELAVNWLPIDLLHHTYPCYPASKAFLSVLWNLCCLGYRSSQFLNPLEEERLTSLKHNQSQWRQHRELYLPTYVMVAHLTARLLPPGGTIITRSLNPIW